MRITIETDVLYSAIGLEKLFAEMSEDICGNVEAMCDEYAYDLAKDIAEDVRDIVRKTLAAYCDKLTNPSEVK